MEKICPATTGKGTQCTRRLKPGQELCFQHEKQDKETLHKQNDAEPWTELDLPEPYKANGAAILQKIRTQLKKGPKKDDGAGFIYIYSLEHESTLNYYKIGLTQRRVTTRMKEWSDIHNERKATQVVLHHQYQVVKGVKFCERLIHLYLKYCNMHRYPYKDGYHSVYALPPNEVLKDGQEKPDDDDNDKERLVAKSKCIEWFCEELTELDRIVTSITELYKK